MNKLYMLGDSITEWNILSHTEITNYGKAGWTTSDLLNNFPVLEDGNLTFLMIGVNDLNYGVNFDKIMENFREFKDRLKNVDLRVFSILPSRDKALNEKIKSHSFELQVLFGKNEKDIFKSIKKESLYFLMKFPNIEIRYKKFFIFL